MPGGAAPSRAVPSLCPASRAWVSISKATNTFLQNECLLLYFCWPLWPPVAALPRNDVLRAKVIL